MSLFEPIFTGLNDASIRYVVVGGLAVVLHGHARLTADIDLVIDLETTHVKRTLATLTQLGLRPRLPVTADLFADPAVRQTWIRERKMRVFSLFDPSDPLRTVDLFAEHPIEFEALWSRSVLVEIARTSIRIASIPDLIALKTMAGRPQDLDDIEQLKRIQRRGKDSRHG